MKLCEHVQHVSVIFVLKLSNYFRDIFSITKLAYDALKELVASNSCEYQLYTCDRNSFSRDLNAKIVS